MPSGYSDNDAQNHDRFFHRMSYGTDMIRANIHNELKGIITHIKYDCVMLNGQRTHDIDFSLIVGTMSDSYYGAIAQCNSLKQAFVIATEIRDDHTIRIILNQSLTSDDTIPVDIILIGKLV